MKRFTPELSRCRRLIVQLLLVVFTFLVLRGIACAIPTSDSQKNLQKAITPLDTLSQNEKKKRPENFQRRLIDSTAAIPNVLPEKESIESDGSVVEVDNSWFH